MRYTGRGVRRGVACLLALALAGMLSLPLAAGGNEEAATSQPVAASEAPAESLPPQEEPALEAPQPEAPPAAPEAEAPVAEAPPAEPAEEPAAETPGEGEGPGQPAEQPGDTLPEGLLQPAGEEATGHTFKAAAEPEAVLGSMADESSYTPADLSGGITIGQGTTAGTIQVVTNDGTQDNLGPETVIIAQGGATPTIVVDGVAATLELADVTVNSGIIVQNSGALTLRLASGTSSTSMGAAGRAGVDVAQGNSLTIEGTGTLNTWGNTNAAGIGSGPDIQSGTITIAGGAKVNANGGKHGAGIGSGSSSSLGALNGGVITITENAVVVATAGKNGAGIGGGHQGAGGSITISGSAKVSATGYGIDTWWGGAGIGGGNSGAAGTITITGSPVVNAIGANPGDTQRGAAAIGAGYGGANGIIRIYGGRVDALGGTGAAAIGGSTSTLNTGEITIEGGIIDADGGSTAAGIGGGLHGYSGNITIKGGEISAIGGRLGAGIGSGNAGSCGTITITGDAKVKALGLKNSAGIGGGSGSDGGNIIISGSVDITAQGSENGAGIGGGRVYSAKSIAISGSGTIKALGGKYAAAIGGGGESHYDTGSNITISGSTTINAYAGEGAAAIGGGLNGAAGSIAITGCKRINAYAQSGGAGIGASHNSQYGGTIAISGGTIYAYGGTHSAGIGGGAGDIEFGGAPSNGVSTAVDIELAGTADVVAIGGTGGAGLGSGELGGTGSITIKDSARISAIAGTGGAGIGGGKGSAAGSITITGGISSARSQMGAGVGPGAGGGASGDAITITGGYTTGYSTGSAGIGGGSVSLTASGALFAYSDTDYAIMAANDSNLGTAMLQNNYFANGYLTGLGLNPIVPLYITSSGNVSLKLQDGYRSFGYTAPAATQTHICSGSPSREILRKADMEYNIPSQAGTTLPVEVIFEPYYTVRFIDHDGTVLYTQAVKHGSNATAPASPRRPGHTFTGWSESLTSITSDTDVLAQYDILRYTVRFIDHDDTVLKTQTVSHGGDATAPASPTRTGHVFTGWSRSYANITGHTDVHAQYRPLPAAGSEAASSSAAAPESQPVSSSSEAAVSSSSAAPQATVSSSSSAMPLPPGAPASAPVASASASEGGAASRSGASSSTAAGSPSGNIELNDPPAGGAGDGGTGTGGAGGGPADTGTNGSPNINTDIAARFEAQSGNLLYDIVNGNIPLGGFGMKGAWGFLNLMMGLGAAVAAVLLFVRLLLTRRPRAGYAEEEAATHGGEAGEAPQQAPAHRLPCILAMLSGLLPGLLFLILENMALPMAWVNENTLPIGVVFLLCAALMVLQAVAGRRHSSAKNKGDAPLARGAYTTVS